ncbi:hypothetical protein PIB30_085051 [Stylosanthes scabra]|uniref:Uncharacterized protein n=1 Tax=Stylosanthes scabra TaxID=79078 RepID=A0ABU6SSY6_9FABA|nr:hypothetical protein [Stylosanthes scabra]
MLQKFANQTTINLQVQPQPSTSSPLPSQPLPNPKGGINAVHVERDNGEEDEVEDEEGENDWLYELLAELANSDRSDDEEEGESEDDEEAEEVESEFEEEEEKVNEGNDKGKTFFIATIFSEGKIMKEEIPIKCEDPGPCTVTCKIRGVDIPDCLSDPEACGNVTPFEGNKGGRPQVLLGRPFLKTGEFKLIYYDEIFTFSVGNVIEIFHLTPPPKPPKKGIHQLKVDNAEVQKESPGRKAKVRIWDCPKEIIGNEKGSRNPPLNPTGRRRRYHCIPRRRNPMKIEPRRRGRSSV